MKILISFSENDPEPHPHGIINLKHAETENPFRNTWKPSQNKTSSTSNFDMFSNFDIFQTLSFSSWIQSGGLNWVTSLLLKVFLKSFYSDTVRCLLARTNTALRKCTPRKQLCVNGRHWKKCVAYQNFPTHFGLTFPHHSFITNSTQLS